MKEIIIQIAGHVFKAQLNDSKTANAVYQALPICARVDTWGNEIYCEIPVQAVLEPEYASDLLEMSDLAFWPRGNCFCVFFGPTPSSDGEEIRPASQVNVIGKIAAEKEILKSIQPSAEIMIRKGTK